MAHGRLVPSLFQLVPHPRNPQPCGLPACRLGLYQALSAAQGESYRSFSRSPARVAQDMLQSGHHGKTYAGMESTARGCNRTVDNRGGRTRLEGGARGPKEIGLEEPLLRIFLKILLYGALERASLCRR